MEVLDQPLNVTCLRLSSGTTTIVSGTQLVDDLDVPLACAQRCGLIQDLLQQESTADLPLPLSAAEVLAWLTFAQQDKASDGGADEHVELHDNLLLDALTAADFLKDSGTVAAVSRLLLLALARGGKGVAASAQPSEEELARAAQMTRSMAPRFWPAVMAAMDRRGGSYPFSAACPREPAGEQLSRLVQLLPPTFHPAIVQACFSGDALVLPPLPACGKTCALHSDRGPGTQAGAPPLLCLASRAVLAEAPRMRPGACGPECASILFRLLAAAAPLAGGSSECAWGPAGPSPADATLGAVSSSAPRHSRHPPAAPAPLREGSGADQEPAAKRARVRRSLRTHAAGADAGPSQTELAPSVPPPPDPDAGVCMTQLTLCLSGVVYRRFSAAPEPPRWCVALAQLRTLRELSISAAEPAYLSPVELSAALQSLPALQVLRIRVDCVADDWGAVDRAALARLVSDVATLTQLSELSLIECFCLPSASRATGLSQLMRLTSLTLVPVVEHPAVTQRVVRAVKQLTGLRELYVGADVGLLAEPAVGAELVLGLCAATELTALTSLSTLGLWGHSDTYLPVSRLHSNLARGDGQPLTQLAALALTGYCQRSCAARLGRQPIPCLLKLLAATPALCSLSVGWNWLRDVGLLQVAKLPYITGLTRLAIEGSDATHAGVCAVLQALVKASAAGGPGVRELDISENIIAPPHAAALAALLRQMTTLEALNIRHMFEDMAGLREVVGALEALPRLRRLRVFLRADPYTCDRVCGAEAAVAPLLSGLGHVLTD